MTLRYDRYYTPGRATQKQAQQTANAIARKIEREKREREEAEKKGK